MSFELDEIVIEEGCRSSVLADRVSSRAPNGVPIRFVADGREAARPTPGAADPFEAGKRRMVIMNRRAPFMMACPAGSSDFACCGYLVMVLASNCPMDCSYCFLQEYLTDNPGFQVYAN
jgi:spore photoproduct lyase